MKYLNKNKIKMQINKDDTTQDDIYDIIRIRKHLIKT